jgi:hypothetical protein
MKLRRYWKGYLAGTNRGRAFAVISGGDRVVKVKALLYDQVYGPATIRFEGSCSGNTVELRLVHFEAHLTVAPLDGELHLQLETDGNTALGTWKTDIATEGRATLRRASWWQVRLPVRRAAVRLRAAWYRWLPTAYCAVLLALAIVAVFRPLTIGWQPLLLLLLPAPLLFQRHLGAVIQGLGLRKAGPFEFERQKPITEFLSGLVTAIPGLVEQGVREQLAFRDLDQFFVPRTKLILLRLAQQGSVTMPQFEQIALEVGVPKENLIATSGALLSSGCALFSSDRLTITEHGRAYVGHLVPSGSLPSTAGSNQ